MLQQQYQLLQSQQQPQQTTEPQNSVASTSNFAQYRFNEKQVPTETTQIQTFPEKTSNFDTGYQFKKKEDDEYEDYSEKIAHELEKCSYLFDEDSEEEKKKGNPSKKPDTESSVENVYSSKLILNIFILKSFQTTGRISTTKVCPEASARSLDLQSPSSQRSLGIRQKRVRSTA